jgi:protein disulfide isomerase family A protein 3
MCLLLCVPRVIKVAKKFADAGKKVTFAVSSVSEFSNEVSEYGLSFSSEKGTPVVGARDAADQKFSMKADFRLPTQTCV